MSQLRPNSEHIAYIDTLRIIAIALVCLIHAPVVYFGATYPLRSLAMYETVVSGVHIFLMISGALLLPVTRPWREFVARRLPLVGWPLLVWTVVYLAIGFATGTKSWHDVLMLPLMPADRTLWYVYLIIVIYITLPVVSVVIEKVGKRGVQAYLVLWALSTLIPFQHGIFNAVAPQQHALSFFHNYYGYVVLGYYLRQWPLPLFTRKHGWWIALVMLAGIVGMPLIEFTCQPDLSWADHVSAVTDLSINTVMTSTLIFTVVQRYCPEHYANPDSWATRAWRTLARCTFGIYLMHMVVLEHISIPIIMMIDHSCGLSFHALFVLASVGSAAMTLAVSAVITRLILLLPCSKFIVGR